jgi:hypothetical protein
MLDERRPDRLTVWTSTRTGKAYFCVAASINLSGSTTRSASGPWRSRFSRPALRSTCSASASHGRPGASLRIGARPMRTTSSAHVRTHSSGSPSRVRTCPCRSRSSTSACSPVRTRSRRPFVGGQTGSLLGCFLSGYETGCYRPGDARLGLGARRRRLMIFGEGVSR